MGVLTTCILCTMCVRGARGFGRRYIISPGTRVAEPGAFAEQQVVYYAASPAPYDLFLSTYEGCFSKVISFT